MIKKIFATIAVLTFCAYGVFVVVLYHMQERLIFPGPYHQNVSVDMDKFSEVSIPTEDGETLYALYHPPKKNEPVIIFFHGNGDAAIYQERRSEALIGGGFGVLLLEYRGYPGSTGEPSEEGFFADGRAAYAFLRKTGNKSIGLYAHSLGTGVAVKLASERDIFALVLEAPFDSLMSIAQKRYPFVPVSSLLKHPFRSDEVIPEVTAPILFQHGTRDWRIPLENVTRLKKLAKAKTELKVYSGAGHIDLWRYGALEDAVEFFQKTTRRNNLVREHILQKDFM